MNREVRDLFNELSGRTPEERERVLADRGVTDEVRRELEELLQYDTTSVREFDASIASMTARLLVGKSVQPVDQCGSYRLIRLLGQGGMGAVYLGERADGAIDHQVAIKLASQTGASPEFTSRFLLERRILAQLNHPCIARLIDAGTASNGQPYLVMEYVDGVPIDQFAAGLPLNAKLELFMQVCDAIAYAHRRLVIHRDIKPSNILVTPNGQPKLLDFGIAKILDDSSERTVTAQRFLTPGYASPEHIEGGAQGTPSDVYSLGAVLCRLLTGSTPQSPSDAAQVKLDKTLPTDLRHVIAKAMRAEPDERYPSADAFAADIRAFLDLRPVAARSGNAWYKARKLARKYWLPATAAVVAVVGLSVGLIVANRERALAQRRFDQVRQLASQLSSVQKDIRFLPGSVKANERIISISQDYLSKLGAEAAGDLGLSLEIGVGYLELARAQGGLISTNAGKDDDAYKSLILAGSHLDRVLAAQPQNRGALLASLETAHDIMVMGEATFRKNQSTEQSSTYAGKVEQRIQSLMNPGPLSLAERETIVRALCNASITFSNLNKSAESMDYALRAVRIAQDLPANRTKAASLLMLANSQRMNGDLAGALKSARECRAISEGLVRKDDSRTVFDYASALQREGQVLGDEGISLEQWREAAQPLGKSFDLMDEFARNDPKDARSRSRLAYIGVGLGYALQQYDPGRAVAIYDEAIQRIVENSSEDARRYEVLVVAGSSYALRRLGRRAEAGNRVERAIDLLRQLKEYPADRIELGTEVEIALRAWADHLDETGRTERALGVYDEIRQKARFSGGEPNTNLPLADVYANLLGRIAAIEHRLKHVSQAESARAEVIAIWQAWNQKLPANSFIQRRMDAAAGHLR